MHERKTRLFGNKGYRDDELFGDHVRNPLEVAIHETFVLGNVDIPLGILEMHLDKLDENYAWELKDVVRHITEPETQDDPSKTEENDRNCLLCALNDILGERDFCVWLCPSPEDVASAYIEPFPDADERMHSLSVTEYEIPEDAIMLTCENAEGTLFAWKADSTE